VPGEVPTEPSALLSRADALIERLDLVLAWLEGLQDDQLAALLARSEQRDGRTDGSPSATTLTRAGVLK
jgi:hypothetical protein